ncbi:Acyl-coenzyme A thioesterase 13 [Spatholobus suberectus]|nr:Acyl-coenzyme A thioesterase 13 [Spatholobus suberectus]
MELECIKKSLEEGDVVDGMPSRLLEPLILNGLRVDLIEPGRVVCSMKIPPRLLVLNARNSLHRGATATLVDVAGAAAIPSAGYSSSSGVSVEINVSYFDAVYVHEEIEIDARVLRVGKAVAVVSVEFRKKKTGKVFAQGRHTKYLAITSKM